MKICIATNSGFQVRYILQSDIFKRLKSQNVEIKIVCFPSEIEFIKDITNNEVEIFSEPERPIKSSVEKYLEYMRFFTRARYNSTSEEIYQRMFKLGTSPLRRFGIHALMMLSRLIRNLSLLRYFFVYLEKLFSNYSDYSKLLKDIKPDLLILNSHGAFGFDKYIAYAAKDQSIKICTVILSWDNVTSQTYPAYYANYVIAWTEIMKKNIVSLIDYKPDQVLVGGSAYFDKYYSESGHNDTAEILKKNGLNQNKKLIFFATRSPNTYPWHPNVAKTIAEAINNHNELNDCQLVIRPHPIHYRTNSNGDMVYNDVLEKYIEISENYPNIYLNIPEVYKNTNAFLMKSTDAVSLRELMDASNVIINIFSTINIEAAILNKPIINICYEYDKPMYKFNRENPRFNILSDARETHNQRIVDSGGAAIAYSELQLIEHIKRYINNPELDEHGRKLICDREVGPNRGNAGNTIADMIIGYSNNL